MVERAGLGDSTTSALGKWKNTTVCPQAAVDKASYLLLSLSSSAWGQNSSKFHSRVDKFHECTYYNIY